MTGMRLRFLDSECSSRLSWGFFFYFSAKQDTSCVRDAICVALPLVENVDALRKRLHFAREAGEFINALDPNKRRLNRREESRTQQLCLQIVWGLVCGAALSPPCVLVFHVPRYFYYFYSAALLATAFVQGR